MAKLLDYCVLIRSKNAGPFTLTFDFMFKSLDALRKVEQANLLTRELFARLYKVDPDAITLVFHEAALAAKVSFPRPHVQCDMEDGDCYGGQQYAPLMDLSV
jgi:hypothetical protein